MSGRRTKRATKRARIESSWQGCNGTVGLGGANASDNILCSKFVPRKQIESINDFGGKTFYFPLHFSALVQRFKNDRCPAKLSAWNLNSFLGCANKRRLAAASRPGWITMPRSWMLPRKHRC